MRMSYGMAAAAPGHGAQLGDSTGRFNLDRLLPPFAVWSAADSGGLQGKVERDCPISGRRLFVT